MLLFQEMGASLILTQLLILAIILDEQMKTPLKAILLQVILQLALLAHFHGRMTQIINKVDKSSKEIVAGDGISWAVWTIFILYSLFNVFGVPVILSYIDRRERQEMMLGPKTEREMEVSEYQFSKSLRVGESNPGRPRDRREYSPLY